MYYHIAIIIVHVFYVHHNIITLLKWPTIQQLNIIETGLNLLLKYTERYAITL